MRIFFICTFAVDSLNEFTGDVDIYDKGRMGRGKNAGTWHHSLSQSYDIIYYLAMQPWRHFEWIYKDANNSNRWVKAVMNEDRTCTVEINKDNTKVLNDPNQDFCRKEYTYPLEEFKIDWDAVPHEHAQRHAETINGQTCIEYKAKRPLTAIYIKNDNTLSEADLNTKSITVCRMVFIGGRNITFRSFNSLDTGFYKDYKKNTTDLCTIKAAEPNVNADAEMIIGITDKTVLKTFFEKISQYNKLKVFKSLKLRWYSATGSSSMNVEKGSNGEFTLDSIKLMQQIVIKSTKVDNLIDIALTDFDNLKKSTNFKRGVIMVFTDKALGKDRDAAREFDHRNGYYTENGVEFFNPKNSVNVTVFMNILNYKEDETFSAKALTHVSLGAHYFESFDANGFIQNVVSMINVIEANLTERCDTETCNGFCDGKNRCTCPMCCENDCYYTYCDTTSGTCTPWPKAKPKMKIICEDVDKCKNTYHCVDGYGCVIKEYAKGCEPASKCNVTKCDSTTGKCKYVDTCTRDTVPYNGKCYTYKCQNGECVRDQVYATCPNNDDLCKELTCTDNACVLSEKKCVKTAPYTDMDCYVAKCENGQCKNKLKCDDYSVCGTDVKTPCYCNAASNYKCKCDPAPAGTVGLCTSDQHCDYREDPSKCVDCDADLYNMSCKVDVCEDGHRVTKDFDCSAKLNELPLECVDYYDAVCQVDRDGKNDCILKMKTGLSTEDLKVYGCRYCILSTDNKKVTVSSDVCEGLEESSDGAKKVCENEKCEWDPLNCTDFFWKKFQNSTDNCPFEAYEYKFDSVYGVCRKTAKNLNLKCSECKDKQILPTCENKYLSKSVSIEVATSHTSDDLGYEKYVTIDMPYKIPKVCLTDHCIPAPRLCGENEFGDYCVPREKAKNYTTFSDDDCMSLLKSKGYNVGDCQIEAKYVYPDYFSFSTLESDIVQIDDFYALVDDVARCEFTIGKKNCGQCMFTIDGGKITKAEDDVLCTDSEDELTQIGIYMYRCNVTTDKCEPKPVECLEKKLDPEEIKQCKQYEPPSNIDPLDCSTYEGGSYVAICDDYIKELEKKNKENTNIPAGSIGCGVFNCDYFGVNVPPKCSTITDDSVCDYHALALKEEKIGCTVPTGRCDENTKVCKTKTIVSIFDPLEEDYYKVDEFGDPIDANDKCVTYKCENGGKRGHHYVFVDNLHESEEAKPKHKCETRYCDPATGEIVVNPKLCDIMEDFPDLPDSAILCNRCECNYKTGKMTLLVNANTTTERYTFDACGGCTVYYYDEEGNYLNQSETPPCELKEDAQYDGVVAGAVTVGVVVVAVTCSLVIVGIGAMQTYQLVSSAMKNTVGTMNENPNFEAADKAATNSNFAG